MYGVTQRALGQMKSLVDALYEYQTDEETYEGVRGELERFLEIDKRNWSRELRDLGDSIVELVMNDTD